MQKISRYMQFATVLLLFPFQTHSLFLLPICIGYGLLWFCIKKLECTYADKYWFLAGLSNMVLCVVAYGIPMENIVWMWLVVVLSFTLDLILFYGLTTIIYHKTGNMTLLANRKKLLVFSAVSVVAYCLWLNVSYFIFLVWLGRIVSCLYFINAICPKLYKMES